MKLECPTCKASYWQQINDHPASLVKRRSGDPFDFVKCYQSWKLKPNQQYSQFGEDGLIESLFEFLGTTNRYCFEFGASDGVHFSNTKHLRNQGWRGILIEANDKWMKRLRGEASGSVAVEHATVTPDNVNDLLADLPLDSDFGSIDVDGQDYWIWDALEVVRPYVVCIEYNPRRPDEVIPERGIDLPNRQATLGKLAALGLRKGYTLAAQTFCNLLFVLDF